MVSFKKRQLIVFGPIRKVPILGKLFTDEGTQIHLINIQSVMFPNAAFIKSGKNEEGRKSRKGENLGIWEQLNHEERKFISQKILDS